MNWTVTCKLNAAIRAGLATASLLVLVGAGAALAAVPPTALIEWSLATSGGAPAADGNYGVKLGLYKEAAGGSALWSEQASLAVSAGQFQHALGSAAPLGQAVLLQAAYIGIAVGSDPELPRKPLHAVLFAARAGTAEAIACSGCISTAHLDAALQSDLKNVIKASDLADVAKSGAYGDLQGLPNLAAYAKTADLKKVALTGAYADLGGLPVLAKVDSACGTNLVVKGIKADGSLDCTAGGGGQLPPDGIDDVSNGLIFNTFVDSKAGAADVQIPDFAGPGVTDTLDFPDIGTAQKLWIAINLQNSDVSAIKIELYGPGMSAPYIVYAGNKTGNSFNLKFNDDTPLAQGDMNKDWVGKNIKGLWSLTVKDSKDNVTGNVDGKLNWSMNVQTLSNKKIQIKGDLIVDGKIVTGGSDFTQNAVDFQICSLTTPQSPCVVGFTKARSFLDASKHCAAMKADICTDSQAYAARRQSIWNLQYNWTNSFADNDSTSYWQLANGGVGDNHPDSSTYLTPCCYNVTPQQPNEQKVSGIRVLKVNNSENATWEQAVDACLAVNADLCDKGQYYMLRQQGTLSARMWSSDHSDNDGQVCNSSIGSTSDDTNPGEKYGYACCATDRTTLACASPNFEVGGVCVAKVFNSNSYAFSTAASSCASMGARICSIAQSAVLRSAGQLNTSGNWTASHSDNDGNQAGIGVDSSMSDNPTDGQGWAYACCF